MEKRVLVMSGDGVGPEVTAQGLKILKIVAPQAGIELVLDEALVGGSSIDATGEPLSEDALTRAKAADAILFGSVGGPQWDHLPFGTKPETGILQLRHALDLFANLRPAKVYEAVADASTLKREVVVGTDLMVIRELTGGIYFGEPRGITQEGQRRVARNTMVYSDTEIERILRVGFETARKRRKKLLSVDKANALEVGQLWREVATELAAVYPDIELSSMYVDNAAMQLIREPRALDTIVTGNLFGDILSDEAAMLTGSIGLLPSASIGGRNALYEPIHGSAPDIAGQDIANPFASILSVGMMFRYSFDLPEVDERIQQALTQTLVKFRTQDIMREGKTPVGCVQMGDLVAEALQQ